MKRDLDINQFKDWQEKWMREKGCPFFTCAQMLHRKVCGNSYICGCLFTYQMYKEKKWIKECDIKLTEDDKHQFPTKICPACTSSMCIKMNHKTGQVWAQSPCKLMNDYFEKKGMTIDRSLEKYHLTWGAYLFPIIDEKMFLKLQSEPEMLNEFLKNGKSS